MERISKGVACLFLNVVRKAFPSFNNLATERVTNAKKLFQFWSWGANPSIAYQNPILHIVHHLPIRASTELMEFFQKFIFLKVQRVWRIIIYMFFGTIPEKIMKKFKVFKGHTLKFIKCSFVAFVFKPYNPIILSIEKIHIYSVRFKECKFSLRKSRCSIQYFLKIFMNIANSVTGTIVKFQSLECLLDFSCLFKPNLSFRYCRLFFHNFRLLLNYSCLPRDQAGRNSNCHNSNERGHYINPIGSIPLDLNAPIKKPKINKQAQSCQEGKEYSASQSPNTNNFPRHVFNPSHTTKPSSFFPARQLGRAA